MGFGLRDEDWVNPPDEDEAWQGATCGECRYYDSAHFLCLYAAMAEGDCYALEMGCDDGACEEFVSDSAWCARLKDRVRAA